MRRKRIFLAALALLSAGLLTGASLSIGASADRVEVWKTDLYGQAAALEGLEVTLPLEAEEQLFWTSVFPAGAPEQAETDFCTFLARRSIRYRSAVDSVGVRFTGNGGGHHYLSADSDDSSLIQIFQGIVTHTGNVTGNLLRSQLGVTGLRLIFLNVYRCVDIILYQTLA